MLNNPAQLFLPLAIYTVIVFVFIWLENRRISYRLHIKEAEMVRRMYEVSILKELGERIGYSLNVQKIADIITGSLRQLLSYSTVSYLLLSDEGRVIFHSVLEESVNHRFVEEVKHRLVKALSAMINKEIKAELIDESISGTITDESNRGEIRSFFNIPVVINSQPVGILNVASTKDGLYKEEEMSILYTIMNQASSAVSKLENILNQEKGKLNSMVASMADGVFMVDTRNRLLVINPAAIEMLGISKPQPTIFDVLDALASKFDLRTKIEESIKNDRLTVEEQLPLNQRVLRVLISPVKDAENKALGAVVLFHDITKEKAIEKMREDFTSMMVHELRSPLTGIRSIANLLREEKIKNERQKYQEFIDLIVTNSASMLDLVNDLLDVAKLEAGKFQVMKKTTDLANVIKVRVQSFQSLAAENHLALESKVEEGLPTLDLDENKIGQVLNNLLSNALKFTQKGKITVSAFVLKSGQDLADRVLSLGLIWPGIKNDIRLNDDNVVVAVTDTGIGIPESQIGKLFNKFTQLEQSAVSEKKGTGLGLVISKGIVEAHGGKINVVSDEGKGTTFYFTLPLKNPNIEYRNPKQIQMTEILNSKQF
ncbi:MAG: GAF domain-containing protein [Candidatus Doudnabacteria bacterium]|nr:GAF domain-containing protein [Candidatus Doudnabacteria bacterium]